MFESYAPYNLKPFIDSSNSFFVVKLTNVNYGVSQNDVQKVAQNDVPNTLEDQIIQLILKNNKITRKEMASIVGKSIKTIERTIGGSKKIKYVGSSKTGHWEIIQ